MSEVPVGDWHKQVRCKDCGEMIDARAATCYLCGGDPSHERNVALENAVHADRVNSQLYQQQGRARAESRIRTPGINGGTGPDKLYNVPGARDLAARFKRNLQEAGFGE